MRGLLGVVAVLLCAASAMAGPLAPCIRAASSASGNFLVVTDAVFSHPLPATAERVTLQVVPKEMFATDTIHKVTSPSPNTYWISEGWNGWSVEIQKGDSFFSPCPIPILSDDGEFLILLQSMSFDSAMRIYRRSKEGHKGSFVKDIALKDIWPEHKLEEWRSAGITDETPEWFAGGGSFAFSSDSLTLIHTTRWGNTVRIGLANGLVSQK